VRLLVSMLVAVLALALVACGGGDDDDAADSSTDVNQLLEETFAGGKEINSGKVDLAVRLEAQGGDAQGPVTLDLSGPFQSEGAGKLPQFQVELSFEGGGQSITAGATSTSDQGFISFQGTDYEVSGPVFQQFKAAYEEAQKQSSQDQGQSLATLGIDPRKWLTDAKNEGEADVGGTETIKITGGVDVDKLLDDVNAALERLRSLGVQGSEDLPEQLSDEQKRQVTEAVDNLSVEIYTGKEDKILRRLVVALDLTAPEGTELGGAQSANVRLDLQLLEVNEDQEISAPADARPFSELTESLGGLGLGGAGGSGSGSGSGGGGGATPENLDEYSECVQDAGSDTEKLRECSELLQP
jgi:hypothetical protein